MTRHAVVVGASVAGLLAARVLAGHFDEVTIVERDTCDEGIDARKGVPQVNHIHLLSSDGIVLNYGRDMRWCHHGAWKLHDTSGLQGHAQARSR